MKNFCEITKHDIEFYFFNYVNLSDIWSNLLNNRSEIWQRSLTVTQYTKVVLKLLLEISICVRKEIGVLQAVLFSDMGM